MTGAYLELRADRWDRAYGNRRSICEVIPCKTTTGWLCNCKGQKNYLYWIQWYALVDGIMNVKTMTSLLDPKYFMQNQMQSLRLHVHPNLRLGQFCIVHICCLDYAELIHQAGIVQVFYRHKYKNNSGVGVPREM